MVVEWEVKMDSTRRNPREMTDEETMKWMQELVTKLTKEKVSSRGACSLEALKNRIRRNILNALEEGPLEINEISERVGVSGTTLRYHLNFLTTVLHDCWEQVGGVKSLFLACPAKGSAN
jgi:hypothetical protein